MGLLARVFFCSTCCAFVLGLPFHLLAQEQRITSADPQAGAAIVENHVSAPLALAELPDSPGAAWAKSQQQASAPQQSSSQPNAQTTQPQASENSDQKLQHPVGTAAAEAPKVSGVTAAQPSGVALAPAKQRRVRVIALKVGAIIGAGAALGVVIALSEATPSKPPGAH